MKAKSENHAFSKIVFVLLVLISSTAVAQWANAPGQGATSQTINANIGIGTGTPQAKLHVNGFSLFSSTTSAPTNAAYIRGNSTWSTQTTPDYTWYGNITTGIFNSALNVIGFSTAGVEAMRINQNGNVGIGINPTGSLHVKSRYGNVDFILESLNGSKWDIAVGDNGDISFYQPSTMLTRLVCKNNGDVQVGSNVANSLLNTYGNIRINTNTLYLYSGTDVNNGLGFRTTFGGVSTLLNGPALFGWNTGVLGTTNGGEKIALYWNSTGQVLIGNPSTTTLPTGYKLYVQTGILTEKVKVAVVGTGNWSDYVFNADYKLRSIGELENYLLKHKHLPNIPSAEEVVKDGIDVATMDAKLLEKIEELSLYVIELNKKNIELTQRLNKLEYK